MFQEVSVLISSPKWQLRESSLYDHGFLNCFEGRKIDLYVNVETSDISYILTIHGESIACVL